MKAGERRRATGIARGTCLWVALAAIVLMAVATTGSTINVPGDYATIQAAINGAGVGDTIAVAAGTYAGNVTVNKTVTLVGADGCKLQGTGSGNGFLIQAAGVTIDGFEVTGFAIGIRSYGGVGTNYGALTISNANLHGNTQNGILLVYDTFGTVSIKNSTIAGNTQNGIGIANGAKLGALDLSNTVVQGNKNNGIYIANSGTTISSGSFESVTLATNAWEGLHIENGATFSNVTMSGGAIQGNQFGVVTKTSTITNLALLGVVVQNNTGSGLTFTGTVNGLTIEDCVFAGNAWEHIDLGLSWMGSLVLSNAVVRGNVFGDGPWYSVYVQSATFAAGQLVVAENEFLKPWSYGVYNATANLVLAYNNWWGSASGPNIVAYGSANVAYSPWLANGISAATWLFIVDDVGPLGSAGYLQPALDAAEDGDTVYMRSGTYVTQGLVHSGIILQGEPGASIKAPGAGKTYTIAESSNTFDPILFAYGGTMAGSHVSGTARIQADILGLDINGQNSAQASPRFVGILLRNAEGTISGNTIHNMYDADGQGNGPQTFGILVYGDCDVNLLTNVISDFSRGGIGVIGDLVGTSYVRGAAPDPNAVIQGNTVVGNGYEAGTNWWAENGIQIGYGATGQILENTVLNCRVNNPSWSSSGVLIVGSDNVLVARNTSSGSDNGIAIMGLTAWGGIAATGNVLESNDLTGNEYGIALQYDAVNTQITGNVITGNAAEGMYQYGDGAAAEPYGTTLRYNVISGNGYGVVNWGVLGAMDAILNWWGSGDGPMYDEDFSGTAEYAGTGDSIYGSVMFSPWLGTNPDGDAATPGVQVTAPMLIVVAPVGPEPTGGYLNAAIVGSNSTELPYADTIYVEHGAYDGSEPITQPVTLVSEPGSASHTTVTGAMNIRSGSVTIGLPMQGLRINGDITVASLVDAASVHINWCDLYGTATNHGDGTLDAQYNFWGTQEEAVIDARTIGDIDYAPYLPKNADDSYSDISVLVDAGVAGSLDAAIDHLWLLSRIGQDVETYIEYQGFAGAGAGQLDIPGAQILGGALPGGGGGGIGGGGIEGSYVVGETILGQLDILDPVTGLPIPDAVVTISLLSSTSAVVFWGVASYDESTGQYLFELDTSALDPGTYELIIQTDDGESMTHSIVVVEA